MNARLSPIVPGRIQRGSVLAVTVILVLMLTLLALGAFSLNTTQTRIAANSADVQVAFQTAEGALSQVQSTIGTYTQQQFNANTNGLYKFNPANAPLWKTIDWSSGTAVLPGYQGLYSAYPASYFIELLPPVTLPGTSMTPPTPVLVLRVTVRAVGANGSNQEPVMLQKTFYQTN